MSFHHSVVVEQDAYQKTMVLLSEPSQRPTQVQMQTRDDYH